MYSDRQLHAAFNKQTGARTYRAHFRNLYDPIYFTADSKPEAVKIAREYGIRFLSDTLRWVYLVPKGRD